MSGHWNYRLTVRTVDDTELWEVREIYYNKAGNVVTWSESPVAASGESWAELVDDLSRMSSLAREKIWDIDAEQWVNADRLPWPEPAPRRRSHTVGM